MSPEISINYPSNNACSFGIVWRNRCTVPYSQQPSPDHPADADEAADAPAAVEERVSNEVIAMSETRCRPIANEADKATRLMGVMAVFSVIASVVCFAFGRWLIAASLLFAAHVSLVTWLAIKSLESKQ